MHSYSFQAAILISEAVDALRRLDELTSREQSHRLDPLGPLILRLENIHRELAANKLSAATRKTHDLIVRLIGGLLEFENPAYRSALASALGQYRHKPKPRHSKLGGLNGGRPRKDGTPTRTLASKGYSSETLPPPKDKRVRSHPEFRGHLHMSEIKRNTEDLSSIQIPQPPTQSKPINTSKEQKY
jgi:hypothetical protein